VPGRYVGDTASLQQDGKPLPGVAQVAMQQGRYAGRLIHQRISRTPTSRPFRYFDKGNMAIVGKGFAVLQSGRIRVSGFLAWLAWAAVHLEFLAQSSLRVSVFVQWVWTYLTGQRGSRLIVAHRASPGLGFLAKPETTEAHAPAWRRGRECSGAVTRRASRISTSRWPAFVLLDQWLDSRPGIVAIEFRMSHARARLIARPSGNPPGREAHRAASTRTREKGVIQ